MQDFIRLRPVPQARDVALRAGISVVGIRRVRGRHLALRPNHVHLPRAVMLVYAGAALTAALGLCALAGTLPTRNRVAVPVGAAIAIGGTALSAVQDWHPQGPIFLLVTLGAVASVPQALLLETIDGRTDYGDATVPLPGAVGQRLTQGSNRIRRIADQHGNLHRNRAALDELERVLAGDDIRYRPGDGEVPVRVAASDLTLAGQPLIVAVDMDHNERQAVALIITAEDTGKPDTPAAKGPREPRRSHLRRSPPGAYAITVTAYRIRPSTATPHCQMSNHSGAPKPPKGDYTCGMAAGENRRA